jgi:hypothetical protein
MKSNLHDIEVCVFHETDKAYLVAADEEAKRVWAPKSQCELEPTGKMTATLTAPEWLLQEKGLI